jgi:hypothetical protein
MYARRELPPSDNCPMRRLLLARGDEHWSRLNVFKSQSTRRSSSTRENALLIHDCHCISCLRQRIVDKRSTIRIKRVKSVNIDFKTLSQKKRRDLILKLLRYQLKKRHSRL